VSLRRKLERLEATAGVRAEPPQNSRFWERFFHAHENARRELEGREPLPDLPYTLEDLEDDADTLENVIPAYRADPGWQSEQAKAFLDHWEQHIKGNLQRGAQTDG